VRDEIIDAFRDPSTVNGIVRLGVSETIVHTWLPTLMKRVNHAYPNLEFEIEVDISPRLRDGLVTRDLNLAFLLGPIDTPNVYTRQLCSFPVAFVAHEQIAFPHKRIALEHIAERKIITFARHTLPHMALREFLARSGLRATVRASASLEAVMRTALDGLGVAVATWRVGRPRRTTLPTRRSGKSWRLPPRSHESGPDSVINSAYQTLPK
jgi:DNA-binding transcriptional LysR family regulator